MVSATCRITGLPAISTVSLLISPMRRDWPAANRTTPICGAAGSDFEARSRGKGREAISINNPPDAISASSSRDSGTPARSKCNTQSNPFSLGERAQPGMPITGVVWICAASSILPGSTASPSWSIWPPACSMATGKTSRLSTTALQPHRRIKSTPVANAWLISAETLLLSWAQRRISVSLLPSCASRRSVTVSVAV